jgi:TPR repeat protein
VAQHHELSDAKGCEHSVAFAHYLIGICYGAGSNGLAVDMPMAMQWWTKAAEQGNIIVQCTIGEIYLMGFSELAPVGTFDRDVPRGMKNLRAAIDQKSEAGGAAYAPAISKAEALIRAVHAAKSCLGCGRAKTRKLCGGCVDAGHAKARYCGKACQLIPGATRRRRTKPSADLVPLPVPAAPGLREYAATCARNAEHACFS